MLAFCLDCPHLKIPPQALLHDAPMSGGIRPSAPHHTVLVVEDDPDHALLVRLAAGPVDPSLDVRVVGDGAHAIDYLEGKDPYSDRGAHPFPDLVILDLMMPVLDGFGVLEWIRRRPSFASLPVVVLTSSSNPRDERRALRLGASAFHTKPMDLTDLGHEVRGIVTRWLR